MITMMVKMMSFRNQIWSGRRGGAKRPGPDLEGKMNIIRFFDDNNDDEDDELQKPNLEWSKRRCEEAGSRSGRKSVNY